MGMRKKTMSLVVAEKYLAVEDQARLRSLRASLNDYARKIGFAKSGEWTGADGTHRGGPDALWFDGARCFLGTAHTTASASPASAGEAMLGCLTGVRNAFAGGDVSEARVGVALDEKTFAKAWHAAMTEYIGLAGLKLRKKGRIEPLDGKGGVVIVYDVAPILRDRPYVRARGP
jgi:hypothetical protein